MRIIFVLIASLLISCKKEMKLQNKIEIPTTKTIISDSVAKKEFSLPLEQKWNDSIAKLPYELLENEISIVIGVGHGWLAYDELHHFVYSNDSLLKSFWANEFKLAPIRSNTAINFFIWGDSDESSPKLGLNKLSESFG